VQDFGAYHFHPGTEPSPKTGRADRKVVLEADQGKGTTRTDIEHVMRKGNPQSLIAEGNYSLGMKAAGWGMVDVMCPDRDRESPGGIIWELDDGLVRSSS
jgi:hypothetical protein